MFWREEKDWFRTGLFENQLLNQFFPFLQLLFTENVSVIADFFKEINLFEKTDYFKELDLSYSF